MAVSIVASAINSGTFVLPNYDSTATIPASVEPGDLLVLLDVGRNEFSSSSVDSSFPPSGWTSLGTVTAQPDNSQPSPLIAHVLTRVAEDGDAGASVTVSYNGGSRFINIIAAFRGVNTAAIRDSGWDKSAVEGTTDIYNDTSVSVLAGEVAVQLLVSTGNATVGIPDDSGRVTTFADGLLHRVNVGGVVAAGMFAVAEAPATLETVRGTANALSDLNELYQFVIAVPAAVDPPPDTATQDAGDRLRSSISETTGSLLDAVDVRAVDASVQEAYSYAQRLEPQTLTAFREVLRARDSATVDARYYPRPRQNSAMENRYDGVTVLSRLANWYPPREFGTVTELGITSATTANAQEIITYLLAKWATLAPWLTYETVPDLRYRTPGEDYASGEGIATTAVLAIAQDGNNRKTALEVLRDLLSPFPGTVLRQNSTGKLEIVPQVGPDADTDAAPTLTLDTYDLYSVSIGEADPFDIVNRATFTCSSWERANGVEVMQPAYFQIGSLLNMGRAVWYTPPSDRLNLQPSELGTILQEDDMTPASPFTQQTPGLWPVGSSSIPAGTGIGLRDGSNNPTVTLAWSLYTDDGSTTPKETGTDGLSLLQDEIPFDGVWRDTIQWSRSGGSGVIQCRWDEDRQGVEFRLGAWDLEANCFFAPCDGFVVEFTLNDYSVGYAQRLQRSGTFGVIENDDFIPNADNSGNAVEESQTEYGVIEATVNVSSYSFSASQLAEMAKGYVLANITPKVTRELEVSAMTGFRVTFDTIGRKVELPNGDVGTLVGVEYADDFTSKTVSKTATVQVRNPTGSGAINTTATFILDANGDYILDADGGALEEP